MLTESRPNTPEAVYLKAGDPPSKRRMLQTALHLFARHGVEAVTVRQIAQEAGYTNPALFKFFATKDSLALYLFESCYLALYDQLHTVVDPKAPFDQQFDAILRVFFLQLEQDLDAFLFVQDHLRQMWPNVAAEIRKKSVLGLIRRAVEQGIKEGAAPDMNPALMVVAVAGTLQQFARMVHFGEFKGKASVWKADLSAVLRRIVSK